MTNHRWRKSTYSGEEGNCIELAATPTGVDVRDSKDSDGPVLHFTRAELAAFLAGCRAGEFDDLA
jgi:Domain of unknown function (DUF397)